VPPDHPTGKSIVGPDRSVDARGNMNATDIGCGEKCSVSDRRDGVPTTVTSIPWSTRMRPRTTLPSATSSKTRRPRCRPWCAPRSNSPRRDHPRRQKRPHGSVYFILALVVLFYSTFFFFFFSQNCSTRVVALVAFLIVFA